MRKKDGFYTLRSYERQEDGQLTGSMEDYLEMLYRLSLIKSTIHLSELAENLHVRPSSASKMMTKLKKDGYISFEKYGEISLTGKGKKQGKYLLFRHDTLNEFLCMVNRSSCELEQVEKIEHFINPLTVQNMKAFLEKTKENFWDKNE